MKPESSSEYIEHHTELESEDKVKKALEALAVPFGMVEYGESGDERIENYPFLLEFSYESLPEASQPIRVDKNILVSSENIKKINRLKLTRIDNKATLTLSDLVPANYRVLFVPNADGSWSGFADHTNKQIVLAGDIVKPEIILHLLHEVGHAQIFESNSGDYDFSPEKIQTEKPFILKILLKN